MVMFSCEVVLLSWSRVLPRSHSATSFGGVYGFEEIFRIERFGVHFKSIGGIRTFLLFLASIVA